MPDETRPVETWLTDMDGVLVHEEEPIPGATEFIKALKTSGLRFLVLTNNSIFTPRDLRARLLGSGIDVPEEAIWTSALATAQFLSDQRPHGSAYVVGEAGLTNALHDIGYVMTDRNPDYVVLGETRTYSFESITRAIRLVDAPATGSVAALISTATGRSPYFIGKPNPLMMRSALNRLEAHSETTVMVGDRMDTDIISGSRPACGPCWSPPARPGRTRSRRSPTGPRGWWTRSRTWWTWCSPQRRDSHGRSCRSYGRKATRTSVTIPAQRPRDRRSGPRTDSRRGSR